MTRGFLQRIHSTGLSQRLRHLVNTAFGASNRRDYVCSTIVVSKQICGSITMRLRQIFLLEDRAADNITGEVFALRYRASHDTSRSNATRPIGPLPTFFIFVIDVRVNHVTFFWQKLARYTRR